VQIYEEWVALVREALAAKGATPQQEAWFFGGAAAAAYGIAPA
jgi:hypothetical protein